MAVKLEHSAHLSTTSYRVLPLLPCLEVGSVESVGSFSRFARTSAALAWKQLKTKPQSLHEGFHDFVFLRSLKAEFVKSTILRFSFELGPNDTKKNTLSKYDWRARRLGLNAMYKNWRNRKKDLEKDIEKSKKNSTKMVKHWTCDNLSLNPNSCASQRNPRKTWVSSARSFWVTRLFFQLLYSAMKLVHQLSTWEVLHNGDSCQTIRESE